MQKRQKRTRGNAELEGKESSCHPSARGTREEVELLDLETWEAFSDHQEGDLREGATGSSKSVSKQNKIGNWTQLPGQSKEILWMLIETKIKIGKNKFLFLHAFLSLF